MSIDNIPKVGKIYRFLTSAASLAKKGVKESEILEFAKREFGEVSQLMKIQIRKIFKDKDAPSIKNPDKQPGEVIEASFKPGMDKRGKVVEESPSQASGSIMDQVDESMGKIKGASNRITEIQKEIDAMYKPKPEKSDLMSRLDEGIDTLKKMKRPGMDLATGLTRTSVRRILEKNGIEVPDKADPIEVFATNFGADALMDVKNVAEEMLELEKMGKATKSMDEVLEQEGLLSLKVNKDAPQGMSQEELRQIKKEVDQEKMLDDFDPTGRDRNSMGGFNRIGFADGPDDPSKKGIMKGLKNVPKVGKIIKGVEAAKSFVNTKLGKDTVTTADKIKQPEKSTQQVISEFEAREKANNEMDALIKDQIEGGFIRDMKTRLINDYPIIKDPKKLQEAVDDIFPTGDYKYDAEMAADALVENNPKEFNNMLREDLPEELSSEIYGAVLEPITNRMAIQMKKMREIKKEKPIDISDPEVAEKLTKYVKEKDPKGYKDMEEKLQLSNFDVKNRKFNADGGSMDSKRGLSYLMGM